MWGIIAGLIVSKLLHLRRRRYYALSFLWLFLLQIAKTAFMITILTPMTVAEYLSGYTAQIQQLLDHSVGIALTVFTVLLYTVGKAALQCIVIDRFNTLYCRFVLNKKKSTQ